MNPDDIIQLGAFGTSILVIYALVDKVVVPLIRSRINGTSNGRAAGRSDPADGKWTHQEYINHIVGQRLDRYDAELSEHRGAIAAVGKSAEITATILTRVEEQLKHKRE